MRTIQLTRLCVFCCFFVCNSLFAQTIQLSGSVTNDPGFPLPWATVEIYNSTGTPLGYINMEEDEFWELNVPVPASPPENYYAKVLDWSLSNFTPEVWDNIPCNGCDPVANGTPIAVSASNIGGIDFIISGTGWHISGNVQDEVATNLEGVEVCAVKIVHELTIGCATTDINGGYDIGGLQDIPNDITVYISNQGPHAVLQDMWGGGTAECCDFSQADIIDMSAGY